MAANHLAAARSAIRPSPTFLAKSPVEASLTARSVALPSNLPSIATPSKQLALSAHQWQAQRCWPAQGRTGGRKRADRRGAAVASLAEDEREAAAAVEALSDATWAHMSASLKEQVELDELDKPLAEYMTLPASQYSVLDAERIERVDGSTFRCYAHRLRFFTVEVRPVLTVRVDEEPDGCTIRLLSATLEGSPIVVEQSKKFRASMVNRVRWVPHPTKPNGRYIESDTRLENSVEIPGPFRVIPKDVIESTGNKVLLQVLRVALPRFLAQLKKDYFAWASGDTSRKPLGTGEI